MFLTGVIKGACLGYIAMFLCVFVVTLFVPIEIPNYAKIALSTGGLVSSIILTIVVRQEQE